VVTAEAGRLGSPGLLSVEDATGGIVVHLAEGMAAPGRAREVELFGVVAAPYGQLELRLRPSGLRVRGTGPLPAAAIVAASQVGEATEGRLVAVEGSIATTPWKSSAGDMAFDVVDAAGGRIRVMADASSRLSTSSVQTGRTYRLTGIAGQRALKKDALNGYRIWLRDAFDIVASATAPSPSPWPTGGATPIGSVLGLVGADVTIEGTVTTPATLLDATGRRVVVQDTSGAIEVLLPVGTPAPAPGRRVRVHGEVGRAYGAPRLRAVSSEELPGPASVEPRSIDRAPGERLEWQLVRVSGTIDKVIRLGSRWRATLDADGGEVLIEGLPGSRIPSSALSTGRRASITGIVKRPYPGASDRRFSVVPRSPADLIVNVGSQPGARGSGAAADRDPVDARRAAAALSAGVFASAADVDLGALADHAGQLVRVGGLVVERAATGFSLDDGTAIGFVSLVGPAMAYVGLLEPGDAVNAIGRVVLDAGGSGDWAIEVTDAAGLFRVGDLGDPAPVTAGPLGGTGGLAPSVQASLAPAARARRLGLDQLIADGGGWAVAAVSLALMTALSVASTVVRRRRARALAARLAARIQRYAATEPDAA
jgi:hypothetical protein